MSINQPEEQMQWYVMRDLKRANAKEPAYKLLQDKGFEVFTPMKWQVASKHGIKERIEKPIIPDLLFVHASREKLDPIVARVDTLQYRFMRNCYCIPMTVSDNEMSHFIQAVNSSNSTKYYLPEEIHPSMRGRKIRIVGGLLDGYEGDLITTRGSKVKRLLIELHGYIMVGVEVKAEFIQLI